MLGRAEQALGSQSCGPYFLALHYYLLLMVLFVKESASDYSLFAAAVGVEVKLADNYIPIVTGISNDLQYVSV
jgi:hypothetical protein